MVILELQIMLYNTLNGWYASIFLLDALQGKERKLAQYVPDFIHFLFSL